MSAEKKASFCASVYTRGRQPSSLVTCKSIYSRQQIDAARQVVQREATEERYTLQMWDETAAAVQRQVDSATQFSSTAPTCCSSGGGMQRHENTVSVHQSARTSVRTSAFHFIRDHYLRSFYCRSLSPSLYTRPPTNHSQEEVRAGTTPYDNSTR